MEWYRSARLVSVERSLEQFARRDFDFGVAVHADRNEVLRGVRVPLLVEHLLREDVVDIEFAAVFLLVAVVRDAGDDAFAVAFYGALPRLRPRPMDLPGDPFCPDNALVLAVVLDGLFRYPENSREVLDGVSLPVMSACRTQP